MPRSSGIDDDIFELAFFPSSGTCKHYYRHIKRFYHAATLDKKK